MPGIPSLPSYFLVLVLFFFFNILMITACGFCFAFFSFPVSLNIGSMSTLSTKHKAQGHSCARGFLNEYVNQCMTIFCDSLLFLHLPSPKLPSYIWLKLPSSLWGIFPNKYFQICLYSPVQVLFPNFVLDVSTYLLHNYPEVKIPRTKLKPTLLVAVAKTHSTLCLLSVTDTSNLSFFSTSLRYN